MSDDKLTLCGTDLIIEPVEMFHPPRLQFLFTFGRGMLSLSTNLGIAEIDAIHKFAHEQNDKEKADKA